ncbi:winged helix-turn-helix transcriptional regulator [Paenibacillus sp. NPDC058177]|uniref:winged helix-turn-helix transcriptional regulator n=1 Tax=Paenibacillus sp. NPDC058177 TaxID=3346369 RepID=UPI0036DA4DBE
MENNNENNDIDLVFVCGYKDPAAIRELLTKIGDRWSILLILSLSKLHQNRARFSTLEKSIPGISQRMLTLTLRNLERDGLILREVFPEVPPRVEYELTALGASLITPLQGLIDWVTVNWEEVTQAQTIFDSR